MKKLEKTDSWLILSPGRTGSFLVATFIQELYFTLGLKLKLEQHYEIELTDLTPIKPGVIYHSHNSEHLKVTTENTNVVYITRNVAEAALSNVIANKLNKWHYNTVGKTNPWISTYKKAVVDEIVKTIDEREENEGNQVEPFKIEINEIYKEIDRINLFQNKVNEISLPPGAIKIDYKEFENDWCVLYEKLNFNEYKNVKVCIPLRKTPKTIKNRITNWEEISNIIKGLDNI